MKKLLTLFLFTPLFAFSQQDSINVPVPIKEISEQDSINVPIPGKQVLKQDTVITPIAEPEVITKPVIPAPQQVSKFLELGVSPLSYKGDLSQGYEKWTSAFNLGLKRNNKKTWNGHFNLMIGTITGQNPNYDFATTATPNKFFKASLVSVNYDLQYNIIKKDNFILFISQGIGLMRFTTKDEDNNDLADKFSTRAKNETFNNISFIFPHHIGVIYLFKNNYGAGFQLGRLTPGTDYLDNISQLSSYKKPDNIFAFRFSFYAPLTYKEQVEIKKAD